MPVVVKAGAKTLGTLKRRSKKGINRVLANQFRKENKVSILKLKTVKKKRKRR